MPKGARSRARLIRDRGERGQEPYLRSADPQRRWGEACRHAPGEGCSPMPEHGSLSSIPPIRPTSNARSWGASSKSDKGKAKVHSRFSIDPATRAQPGLSRVQEPKVQAVVRAKGPRRSEAKRGNSNSTNRLRPSGWHRADRWWPLSVDHRRARAVVADPIARSLRGLRGVRPRASGKRLEHGRDLPRLEAGRADMAEDGSSEVAARWVRSLARRGEPRRESSSAHHRAPVGPPLVALLLLGLWVGALPTGYWLCRRILAAGGAFPLHSQKLAFLFILFRAPLFSPGFRRDESIAGAGRGGLLCAPQYKEFIAGRSRIAHVRRRAVRGRSGQIRTSSCNSF